MRESFVDQSLHALLKINPRIPHRIRKGLLTFHVLQRCHGNENLRPTASINVIGAFGVSDGFSVEVSPPASLFAFSKPSAAAPISARDFEFATRVSRDCLSPCDSGVSCVPEYMSRRALASSVMNASFGAKLSDPSSALASSLALSAYLHCLEPVLTLHWFYCRMMRQAFCHHPVHTYLATCGSLDNTTCHETECYRQQDPYNPHGTIASRTIRR